MESPANSRVVDLGRLAMRTRPADDHGHMEQGLPSPHTQQPHRSSDLLDVLDLLDLLLTDIQDGDGDVTVDGHDGWLTFER